MESKSCKRSVYMQKADLEEMFLVLRTMIKYKNLLHVDKKYNPIEKYVTRRTWISISQMSIFNWPIYIWYSDLLVVREIRIRATLYSITAIKLAGLKRAKLPMACREGGKKDTFIFSAHCLILHQMKWEEACFFLLPSTYFASI